MRRVDITWGNQHISVGEGAPTFVIAEIGKNFIQSQEPQSVETALANAIALVRAAKKSGASAVKFQTHTYEDEQANIQVVSHHFKGADRYSWVKRNTESTPVDTFWKPLIQACRDEGILFFSTPMSRGAAQVLEELDVPFWKVGSGDLLDFVMLDFLRHTGKPIFISSGMSTLEEVDQAVAFLREKTDKVILLHCVSKYPCPPEDLHLSTIPFFRERYGLPIGFSDHSITYDSSVASVALGACVVEKHFSFYRGLWGSDHQVSLTPDEFRTMVDTIRLLESDPAAREAVMRSDVYIRGAASEPGKVMHEDEQAFRPLFHKTLCAARDLPAGTVITKDDVYAMRPHGHLPGLHAREYPVLLGQRLVRDVRRFDPIARDMVHASPLASIESSASTPKSSRKRKVCVVIINRANYGRIKTVLAAIRQHTDLELQIVAGSSLLLERHGRAADIIRRDGFTIDAEVYMAIEGETPLTMAKSVGLGIVEITNALHTLRPDIVLTIADRFETMATAIAASYMNIPVAHTQGGEVTGSIDESVRHAVTKLAHVHFPATQLSAERLVKMGEEPSSVFMTGCPSIDLVAGMNATFSEEDLRHLNTAGVGHTFNSAQPYLLMMQHPVTTEFGSGYKQIMESIEAVHATGIQALVLWPNIDAGSDDISKGLRVFREHHSEAPIRFYKNFPPELYARVLANATVAIGNSSSFIREGSYLGTPAVLVGSRQFGREHGSNAILNVPHDRVAIGEAIRTQLQHGRYASDPIFGDGRAGARIAEHLARVEIRVQKRLAY